MQRTSELLLDDRFIYLVHQFCGLGRLDAYQELARMEKLFDRGSVTQELQIRCELIAQAHLFGAPKDVFAVASRFVLLLCSFQSPTGILMLTWQWSWTPLRWRAGQRHHWEAAAFRRRRRWHLPRQTRLRWIPNAARLPCAALTHVFEMWRENRHLAAWQLP